MIGYYNYTVILTYLSLVSSVLGMHFALEHNYIISLLCLLLCGGFDSFDGIVARTKERSDVEKKFGIQIDSLVDLVSFGVFPAVIAYTLPFNSMVVLPIMIFYVLTAVIRLAYFNVIEEIRQQETTEKRKFYTGLPVTSVSLILPFLFITKAFLGFNGFVIVYIIALFVIGVLFISKIKIHKPGLKEIIGFVFLGAIIFMIMSFYC